MKIPHGAKEIIENSQHQEKLLAIMDYSAELMTTHTIEQTELQVTILTNHLNEMISRSQNGEKIVEVDPEMFREVSKEALKIAELVTKKVGNLPADEKYILSIHYETAKNN